MFFLVNCVNVMGPVKLLMLLIPLTTSYNIDTLDPIVILSPTRGQYFGYSSVVQDRWVLVGAPLANRPHLPGGGVGLGWGGVYNCSTDATCVLLRFDEELPGLKEDKEGQWAGVSLSLDPKTNGAVTCAHRYVMLSVIFSLIT